MASMSSKTLRAIDLFSGCLNYNKTPHDDITKIKEADIPPHDVILAGFPCQAFSIAGHRKGFEDTRGTLFFDLARIARYHNPKVIFIKM